MIVARPVTLPTGVWRDGRHCRAVSLRSITTADEMLIADAGDASPARKASLLLAQCVTAPPDNDADTFARALTVGDREALLLHLRRASFGNDLECVFRCPDSGCAEPISLDLHINDLLAPAPERPRPSHQVSFSRGSVNYRMRFRLPTGGDLEDAADLASRDAAAAVRLIARRCVETLDPELSLDAGPLPPELLDGLGAAIADHDPQAEIELEVRCPACEKRFATLFEAGAFLLQELEQRQQRLYREVETLAFYYHWSERELLELPSSRRQKYLSLLAQRLSRDSEG